MSIFPTKILMATDGSEEAELALRTVVDLANSTNSELHVVTVGPDPYYDAYKVAESGDRLNEEFRSHEHKTQETLEGAVKKIEEAGGTVRKVHLRMGRPDREIVHLASEMDVGLIVVGSRGSGGLRRALVGSIADSVVRHAHCPVLVVRKEAG